MVQPSAPPPEPQYNPPANTPASPHHYTQNSCQIVKLVAAAIFSVIALTLFCTAIAMPMVQLFIPAIVAAVVAIGIGSNTSRGLRFRASVGTPQVNTFTSTTYVGGGYPASPYRAHPVPTTVFTPAPLFSGPGHSLGHGSTSRTTFHGVPMIAVPVAQPLYPTPAGAIPGAPARVGSAPTVPDTVRRRP